MQVSYLFIARILLLLIVYFIKKGKIGFSSDEKYGDLVFASMKDKAHFGDIDFLNSSKS